MLLHKLLLEAGISLLKGSFLTGYRPDTKPTDVTKFAFTRDVLYNAPIYDSYSTNGTRAYLVSLSYVTGQHNSPRRAFDD